MNILFVTQSKGLEVFSDVLGEIKNACKIKKYGFYTSELKFFNNYIKKNPEILNQCLILKEFDIISEARTIEPDIERLKKIEDEIGDPVLWNALLCDRRIYLGKKSTYHQDYVSRFSHKDMLSILHVATQRIQEMIQSVEPDVILSLDPVTFGDYLFYLFAKANGIPMLFLRTTKINNYIEFNDKIFGCATHIEDSYREYMDGRINDTWIEKAEKYLQETRQNNIRYEGMILIKKNNVGRIQERKPFVNKLISICRLYGEQKKYHQDHHSPNPIHSGVYKKIINPLNSKLIDFRMAGRYIRQDEIEKYQFAFFPLQSEPEIASLIWGKSYMNQIEAIRNIARNLPVGMRLLVKEHPRARGYRSHKYYQKILEIPNVSIVDPNVEVRLLILHSQIVVTISGFVAFESVVFKKPSIMLGGPRPFSILPDSMIRYVDNLNDLPLQLSGLLQGYAYNERALLNYIAATMRGAAPIDYFTSVLKKKDRYGDKQSDEYKVEIKKLSTYILKRVGQLNKKKCGHE